MTVKLMNMIRRILFIYVGIKSKNTQPYGIIAIGIESRVKEKGKRKKSKDKRVTNYGLRTLPITIMQLPI